jgi:hypothetical protein
MNKNFKNTIINYYPLISIILLGLIYLYLELPENILVQTGGADKTWDYPPNIPIMYKYRYGFVSIPILLIGVICYYGYYYHIVIPQTTIWDLGHDFFSKFQEQFLLVLKDPNVKKTDINYKFEVPPGLKNKSPDLYKFFNMIQLSGDPKFNFLS